MEETVRNLKLCAHLDVLHQSVQVIQNDDGRVCPVNDEVCCESVECT